VTWSRMVLKDGDRGMIQQCQFLRASLPNRSCPRSEVPGRTLPYLAMRLLRICCAVALFSLVAACKSVPSSRPEGSTNIILRDQILAASYPTAYDAVRALHPNWLIRRSQRRGNEGIIWVYVDNSRYGDVGTLRNVPGASVSSIRRIDAGTATTRWGLGHTEGVILVTIHTP
jgi:hypothetical protein